MEKHERKKVIIVMVDERSTKEAIEGFVCPLSHVEPMAKWIREGTEENCRSCLLAPITGWYIEDIVEAGYADLADKLREAFDSENDLTICESLDYAKKAVGETLRLKLADYDCMCQIYEQDE